MLPPAIAKKHALEEKLILSAMYLISLQLNHCSLLSILTSFHKQTLIPLGKLCNCNILGKDYSAGTYSLSSVQELWSFCTLWIGQINSKIRGKWPM